MSEVQQKIKKPVSAAERLKELDEKIAKHKEAQKKLDVLKQSIANREKEKERKARTHRLCQCMPLVEKYLRLEGIQPERLEKLLKMAVEHKAFNEFWDKCLARLDSEDQPVSLTQINPVPASIRQTNVTPAVPYPASYSAQKSSVSSSSDVYNTSGLLAYRDQQQK